MKKLKPVIYTTNTQESGSAQRTRQIVLLKALQVTNDPRKLREMLSVRTVADVYRTLDKLAMRREFHEALARAGISFDYVVGGIKEIADGAEKEGDRLKAFQTILRALGMDKYDADVGGGGDFEQELMKAIDNKRQGEAMLPEASQNAPDEYEVRVPEIPQSVKKLRQKESELTDGIYE